MNEDGGSLRQHAHLPGSPPVVHYVLATLLDDERDTPGIHVKQEATFKPEERLDFVADCPVQVHIYDHDGNHTGLTADGWIEYGIPGVGYHIIGDSKFWSVPPGESYGITFVGTGNGNMDLKVTIPEANGGGTVHLFNQVVITPDFEATMQVGPNSDPMLAVTQPEPRSVAPDVNVDKSLLAVEGPPPTATADLEGDTGLEDWYLSDVTVRFSAADMGRGILGISYKEEGDLAYLRYTEPMQLTREGITTLLAGATDRAGIEQPHPTLVTVKIDKTPPETSAATTGSQGNDGWFIGDVTVTLAAADAVSGVAATEYSLERRSAWTTGETLLLTGEGRFDMQYRSHDLAGNVEATRTLMVPIDRTPPTITFFGDRTYDVDEQVLLTCEAEDNLSGIADDPCTTPLTAGPAYTFPLGTHTAEATAVDQAGHTTTAHTSYEIIVTFGGLCRLGTQFVTNQGVAKSLCAKLEAAESALSRDNQNAARGQLAAYGKEVTALDGHHLTSDQAAVLMNLADTLQP